MVEVLKEALANSLKSDLCLKRMKYYLNQIMWFQQCKIFQLI